MLTADHGRNGCAFAGDNLHRYGWLYGADLWTDFCLFPVVSLSLPLGPDVRLRLEFEVLGSLCLDDEKSKVVECRIDLLLLLGVVLLG